MTNLALITRGQQGTLVGPKGVTPSESRKPVEVTPQQLKDAEAQGAFRAQISINKAAHASLNDVLDAHLRAYGRLGGLVSQLYHKVGTGEAGLGELKTVHNQLQTLWNQMSSRANSLNRSNGAIDSFRLSYSNAQSLCKQWPALRRDPNASTRLKTFAGDLSNARGWANGLQGFVGGLRRFTKETDRYIRQAQAYRQGAGPKPVLPDFRPLTHSGLSDKPATRTAVKAMSDGYASASKWLDSWMPQRADSPPAKRDA
jgi:hypothetical protein